MPRASVATATLAAAVAATVALGAWRGPFAVHAAPLPAGSTAAVLSLVDAASGSVEVVRHWPAAPADMTVLPFVPYFLDGCPGPGAIMMLVTGPPGSQILAERAAEGLEVRASHAVSAGSAVAAIIAELRTPGSLAAEAVTSITAPIADMATYERWGYAVFLFIHWTGVKCVVTVQPVPEGYGIPFVR